MIRARAQAIVRGAGQLMCSCSNTQLSSSLQAGPLLSQSDKLTTASALRKRQMWS